MQVFKKEYFAVIIMTTFQISMYKRFASEKVCVDSTHGTNAYDFLLTSLVVVDDEFGERNKTDTGTLTCFFKKLKKK